MNRESEAPRGSDIQRQSAAADQTGLAVFLSVLVSLAFLSPKSKSSLVALQTGVLQGPGQALPLEAYLAIASCRETRNGPPLCPSLQAGPIDENWAV